MVVRNNNRVVTYRLECDRYHLLEIADLDADDLVLNRSDTP